MISKQLELCDRTIYIPTIAIKSSCGEVLVFVELTNFTIKAIKKGLVRDAIFTIGYNHITENFDRLTNGDRICIEILLGERFVPKDK